VIIFHQVVGFENQCAVVGFGFTPVTQCFFRDGFPQKHPRCFVWSAFHECVNVNVMPT
jgi:hypothetical protein